VAKIPGWLGGKVKAKKPRRGSPIHYAQGRGDQLIVQGNPHGHRAEGPQSAWIYDFSCKAQWTKRPDPRAFEEARAWTQDSGWYYRDMLHAAMSGKLFSSAEERITTPTARVKRTTTESLVNGTAKILTPSERLWDNNYFWNPIANTSRLTVRSKGLYLIGGSVQFSGVSGGRRAVGLKVNGTDEIGDIAIPIANTNLVKISPLELWYFEAFDYVEIWAYANVAAVTAIMQSFFILAITPESVLP